MSSFDPFYSTEFKRNTDHTEQGLEMVPILSKKSDSEFVQEILDLGCMGGAKAQTESQEKEKIPEVKEQESIKEESFSSPSLNSSQRLSNSKTSPFHNFQKHLVITLRQVIELKGLQHRITEQEKLAWKLFEIFKYSKKTSRSFLEQIYGIFEKYIALESAKVECFLRTGDLKQVFEPYTIQQILSAQQILRKATVRQLQQVRIEDYLKVRKIQKKSEFLQYIGLFKRELLNGKQRKKAYKQLSRNFTKNRGAQFGSAQNSDNPSSSVSVPE